MLVFTIVIYNNPQKIMHNKDSFSNTTQNEHQKQLSFFTIPPDFLTEISYRIIIYIAFGNKMKGYFQQCINVLWWGRGSVCIIFMVEQKMIHLRSQRFFQWQIIFYNIIYYFVVLDDLVNFYEQKKRRKRMKSLYDKLDIKCLEYSACDQHNSIAFGI